MSAKEEFDVCQETFKSITGETSDLIRLPFGSKPYTSQASYDNIVNAGYKLWDWTLDSEDWKSTSSQLLSTIKKYAKGDEIVLLIHERKQTVAVLDDIIKYLKSEGYEILPIGQSQQEENYWNGKLGSQNQRQVDRLKKVLYLGLVMVLCFSMIGCSNSNAFKVGETEFSNEEVDKVKSILTATQSYTGADYLAQFKESKDNDDKIKQEVISYMIDNEVVYQPSAKRKNKSN